MSRLYLPSLVCVHLALEPAAFLSFKALLALTEVVARTACLFLFSFGVESEVRFKLSRIERSDHVSREHASTSMRHIACPKFSLNSIRYAAVQQLCEEQGWIISMMEKMATGYKCQAYMSCYRPSPLLPGPASASLRSPSSPGRKISCPLPFRTLKLAMHPKAATVATIHHAMPTMPRSVHMPYQ